jgi:hypothetical protein
MTDRWIIYLQQLRYADSITLSLFALGFGLMACWFVLEAIPGKWIDRKRTTFRKIFWGLVLFLDLSLFSYLAFFWPKG